LSLHQNQRGETGKGVLTGGELGMAENGVVDEGNRRENGKELPGLVLQLQRKKEHMRRHLDQATSDERHGGELSPANGGRQQHDPRWRPEEWSPSCKNWGKRSVRSRRNSMHEDSMNGGRSQRLAGSGLSSDGEKMGQRRKLRSWSSFIGGEERSERTTVPHISNDTLAANRSGGDAVWQKGPLPLSAPSTARSV
jgi:hypothetical protein